MRSHVYHPDAGEAENPYLAFFEAVGVIRGMGRAERNMLRAVQGGVEALDRDTTERILAIAG